MVPVTGAGMRIATNKEATHYNKQTHPYTLLLKHAAFVAGASS
jgi:hypothetical protein